MNTGQRYRAPVRWLSFALATVLCGAASCLPQTASALGRSAATTPALRRPGRLPTAAAPPFAVSVSGVMAATIPYTWRPGCPVGRPSYGCCTSVIGDLTNWCTRARSS